MPKIKKYLYIFLLLELFLSYTTAYAQQVTAFDYAKNANVSNQIRDYLCAPTPVQTDQTNTTNGGLPVASRSDFQSGAAFYNNNSGDLFKCINQMYKFAIVVASVVGVFFIVIAGYVYMSSEGNAESVDKAKSIVTSTIASLVILMGGYVFLKAINPDLVTFNSVQPPSVVGLTALTPPGSSVGNGSGVGTGTNNYNLAGYNIGPYATAGNHEQLVTQIYNDMASRDFSTAAGIDAYLKYAAPKTPLTGQMVLNSAQKFNVDAKLVVALMQTDSSLGTAGLGANTFNPGNVGNDDAGNIKNYGNWQAGVDAVANWLNNHRV